MHIENFITVFLIAIALAADAFAVSISSGIVIRDVKIRNAFKIAFWFGFFQAVMPVLGWIAGIGLEKIIQAVDHFIALGLLSSIGIKMLYDAVKKKEMKKQIDPLRFSVLLFLSIATSIDAFAVGLSFAFLSVNIVSAAAIIGIVTFIISFIGVVFGAKLEKVIKNKAQIVGGLILISIGIKIFVEHVLKGI